jgi:hypothetical protein
LHEELNEEAKAQHTSKEAAPPALATIVNVCLLHLICCTCFAPSLGLGVCCLHPGLVSSNTPVAASTLRVGNLFCRCSSGWKVSH